MGMFKRKVIYLSGFDPRGARFYHWLLAEQIAEDNRRDGTHPLTISEPVRLKGDARWSVTRADGTLEAEHLFLGWDDLVRRHWIKGPIPLLRHAFSAYVRFVARMDWRLMRKVPRGSKIALYYPGASLLVLPVLIALLLWPLLALAAGWMIGLPVALALGVAISIWVMRRIHSLWLLRFVIFNDMLARERPVEAMDARLAHFVDSIDAALAEPWDEVVFVTHSNGAILGVPALAELLDRHDGTLPPHFSFVTLGGCIQLLAIRRDSARFHGLLDRLATGRFRWLDIGSPTDGACVPLVDPCIGRPVARPPGLVQLSPRWFRYCDPAGYDRRRRDKYETHFDYLRRLDSPSPLDYLGITASTRPLAESIAAFEAENAPA